LAEASVTFINPVMFGQEVRVGTQVTQLGNKSIKMIYCLEDAANGKELATGSAVLVAYDYRNSHSIPLPELWRRVITEFEGLPTDG
jgi:acyl-CoA thioester hydrolase